MKNMRRILLMAVVLVLAYSNSNAQSGASRQLQEVKQNAEAEMKDYVMVIYKVGPNKAKLAKEAKKLHQEHLAFINTFQEEGIIAMNGEVKGQNDVTGLVLFSIAEMEEVKNRINEDPSIKAGLYKAEFVIWNTRSGTIQLP